MISIFVLTLFQISIMLFLSLVYFRNFLFGRVLTLVIIMINTMILLIRINIVEHINNPKNDPGIIIWWLCCLSIGQKGKFTKQSR